MFYERGATQQILINNDTAFRRRCYRSFAEQWRVRLHPVMELWNAAIELLETSRPGMSVSLRKLSIVTIRHLRMSYFRRHLLTCIGTWCVIKTLTIR